MQQDPVRKDPSQASGSCRSLCHSKIFRYVLLGVGALIILRAVYLFALLPAFYEIVPPAATAATACPTTDTIRGSSEYEAAPVATAAGAIAAANALLQGRADTEAGLAFNAYTCPNPACPAKSLSPVTATPKTGFPKATALSLFAVLKTIFDLFQTTYYTGEMEYDWTATITCR